MEKMRKHVTRRLGCEQEKKIFDDFGDNNDEYVNRFLLTMFNDLEQAGVCKFCKKKTVFIQLKQDRSADEGMTAHAICNNKSCRRKWIVY